MRPPAKVCRAFGVSASRLRRLAGGQGQTWTDGGLVVKPVENAVEHSWVCDVFAGWSFHEQIRVPQSVAAPDGGWVYDGWAAHRWLPGVDAAVAQELGRIRAASDAFHACVRHLSTPDFLTDRDDPWAHGDRVAWENAAPEGGPVTLELIQRLREHLLPVTAASQLVHGDVCGNVLLYDGLPPAVIDWPPYYRPVGFAAAVAATDAITWHHAPSSLLDEWDDIDEWDQLLARALVYRIATTGRLESLGRANDLEQQHARVPPVVDLVLSRLG